VPIRLNFGSQVLSETMLGAAYLHVHAPPPPFPVDADRSYDIRQLICFEP